MRVAPRSTGSASVEVESILHDEIRLARAGQPVVVQAAVADRVSPAPMPQAPAAAVAVSALAPLAVPSPGVTAPAATGAVPVVSVPGQAEGAFVQLGLGAFSTPSNADGLVGRVRAELGYMADRLQLLSDGGRYRLQIVPPPDRTVRHGRRGACRGWSDRQPVEPATLCRDALNQGGPPGSSSTGRPDHAAASACRFDF